jgi:hypothetical protein
MRDSVRLEFSLDTAQCRHIRDADGNDIRDTGIRLICGCEVIDGVAGLHKLMFGGDVLANENVYVTFRGTGIGRGNLCGVHGREYNADRLRCQGNNLDNGGPFRTSTGIAAFGELYSVQLS